MTQELNLFSNEYPSIDKDVVVPSTPVPTKPKQKEPDHVLPVTTPTPVKEHPPLEIVSVEIPIENPTINVAEQMIEESFDFVEDIVEMAEDVVPESMKKHISWIKRKMMWIKRKYKKYRVWWHKLGKIELDPKIRADFRDQRQKTSVLFKRVSVALSELETHRKRFEDAEALANKAQDALTELKHKTNMMR